MHISKTAANLFEEMTWRSLHGGICMLLSGFLLLSGRIGPVHHFAQSEEPCRVASFLVMAILSFAPAFL